MSGLLGLAALAWIDLTAPEQLAPLVLLGIGLGLTAPAAQSASMSAVAWDLAGTAAGIGATMRYLGGIIGVAVMSVLLDVHGTRAEVISDHRTLMAVFAGALLVGLACAALLPGRSGAVVIRKGRPAHHLTGNHLVSYLWHGPGVQGARRPDPTGPAR